MFAFPLRLTDVQTAGKVLPQARGRRAGGTTSARSCFAGRSVRKVRTMNPLARLVESKIAAQAPGLAVLLPGGRRLGAGDASVRLTLADWTPLAHVAAGSVGSLAQDWVEGRIELHGSMRDIAITAAGLVGSDPTKPRVEPGPVGVLAWWRNLLRHARSSTRHTPDADARQVQFHYDVSDDFYALWLDPRRVYSCAYWRAGSDTPASRRQPRWPRAGSQARPHLPQADAARGRAIPRRRRRLGRPAAVGRRELRRVRDRHHACRRTSTPMCSG